MKGFIIGDHSGTTYGQVAEKLNMTEAAAKKSASRMRKRYRDLLREEMVQTVSRPDEMRFATFLSPWTCEFCAGKSCHHRLGFRQKE